MRRVKPDLRAWGWVGVLLAIGLAASGPVVTQQHGWPAAAPPDSAAVALAKPASVAGLLQQARGGRLVPVIVGFAAAVVPEGALSPAGVAAQRERLAEAGDAILGQFRRGSASGVKRFATIPYFAAWVDADALQTLAGLPQVTSVVEDVPEAPLQGESSTVIQAHRVWEAGVWGAGITGAGWQVVVLDTGVDSTHEMFAGGKVVSEACYSTTDGGSTSVCPGGANSTAAGSGANCPASLGEPCGHGTQVAGIAAGNGGRLRGVAPGAGILAIQVVSAFSARGSLCGGSPCVLAWTSDQILGLERVLALSGSHRIASVLLSLGGRTKFTSEAECDAAHGARKAIIDHLRSVHIATVAATGNQGAADGVSAPACLSTVVAVGSTTQAGAISAFSNLAPGLVDVLAPGSSIRSAVPGHRYASGSGTSMAAAHVAGAWALLKAVAVLKGHAGSVETILSALQNTGQAIAHAGTGATYREIRIADAAVQISTGGEVAPGGSIASVPGAVVAPAWTAANAGGAAAASALEPLAGGSLDTSFDPGANDSVFALAVQADGKILVGGDFTALGGGGTGTTTRNYLGRLHADGSLDTSFNPGTNGAVRTVVVQADGKILVGGRFTTLGGGGTGTTTRNYLGRLNPDGSLDTSFDPGASRSVETFAVQADGKILVGGWFTSLGGGGTGTTARNRIARLNPDGSLDTSFNPGANDAVKDLAVQGDGKILVVGHFTTMGGGGTGTTARHRLGRLNPDGSLDMSFNPGSNREVYTLALQPDGKILVGGVFTTLGGGGTGTTTRNRIGRLNADGSLDTSFDSGASLWVNTLALQGDRKILVGGFFLSLGVGTGAMIRQNLGRLNPDGSVDTSSDTAADASVTALALQPDGKILVGGNFTMLGGNGSVATRNRIGRLNADSEAPDAPTGLTASVSGANIALQWTAPVVGAVPAAEALDQPAAGAPTAYVIEAGSGPGLANLANFSTGNTATTFAASGIANGTYYIRVRATNSFGTSGPSNEVTMIVGGGGCTVPPGAPAGLTITQNSGGTVAFRWTAASGGPTTYILEAGSAPGLANLATVDLGGTAMTFGTSGVGAGTYYVRVKAANACGASGASNEVVLIVQ